MGYGRVVHLRYMGGYTPEVHGWVYTWYTMAVYTWYTMAGIHHLVYTPPYIPWVHPSSSRTWTGVHC